MCKVGLVYTSTTPELIQLVEEEVKKQLGTGTELLTYTDPSILAEVREAGFVTGKTAAKLVGMFLQAVKDGADAILNICSSVGEVADCVQDMADYIGVPIVRIDEDMCRDAVRKGCRIGVIATLPTTLEPTKSTIQRVARQMGRTVTLTDGLVEVFGLGQEAFQEQLVRKAMEIKDEADVILLCQGSMAYCEQIIEDACSLPTVSSPRYGAAALKEALIRKGVSLC